MAEPLIKPLSDKGSLVILGPWQNLAIVDAKSGQVIERGVNTGASNDRKATIRFTKPGNEYRDVILVDLATNKPVSDTISLGTRAYGSGNSFTNYRPDPGGAGDLSQQAQRPGSAVAPSISINATDYLTEQTVPFAGIRPETIEGVEPVDVFGVATEASERNKEIILQSFADARGVSRELLDEALEQNKITLEDINRYNARIQAQEFATLGPEAAKTLKQGVSTLEAFSRGRLPDALENEILNQATRAIHAQQASIVGGGAASSFGQRVANQLAIQQRLGLQQSALQATPGFLASALELRRGTPQKLQFDPNQELRVQTGIAGQIAQAGMLSPQAAVEAEFRNVSDELKTQLTNAEIVNRTQQFNAAQQVAVDQFNAQQRSAYEQQLLGYDLFNQRERQNYEQELINQERYERRRQEAIERETSLAEERRRAGELGATTDVIGSTIAGIPDIIDAYDRIFGEEPTKQQAQSTQAKPTVTEDTLVDVSPLPADNLGAIPYIQPQTKDIQTQETLSTDYQNTAYAQAVAMDVPAAKLHQLSTEPVTDTQYTAHQNARINTLNVMPVENIDKEQVQYSDGTSGLDMSKKPTDYALIQSPVPASVYPELTKYTAPSAANNMLATIKAMDTPSKVSILESSSLTSKGLHPIAYPTISAKDTSYDRVDDMHTVLMDQLTYNTIENVTVPETIDDSISWALEGLVT